jgi:hypothetical protein
MINIRIQQPGLSRAGGSGEKNVFPEFEKVESLVLRHVLAPYAFWILRAVTI